jgi:hypothetical protein
MLQRACLTVLFAAGMAIAAISAAQQTSGDYATDLGQVYGGYQQILALKDACDTAVPGTRAANGRAFSAWQTRHQELLAELKHRVTAMIQLASSDERDYARNLGKYEGAILRTREEHKASYLGLAADVLHVQCQRLPELLTSPEGDLSVVFASELKTIRKHK